MLLHPLKALDYISVILFGILMISNPEHPPKQPDGIVVIVDGIFTFFNVLIPANAPPCISSNPSGRITVSNGIPALISTPALNTFKLFGNFMYFRLVQPEKAPGCISSTLSAILISTKLEQPPNALPCISFSLFPDNVIFLT
jgi:hypothetical protein